jgi:amino acid adenylation domain-containing protein
MPVSAHAGSFPLTGEQHEIWLACQLGEAASVSFNATLSIELDGDVDVDALEHAFRSVVARHEALRSTFSADGSSQCIHPRLDLEIPHIEWPVGSAEIEAFLRAEAARPFDLERGPLLRATVCRRPTGVVLVSCVHHLVCDGWSHEIVLRELATFYRARIEGSPPPFPEPPVQISHHALQARATAGSEVARRALEYWRNTLPELPPSLDLPTDFPRPEQARFHGTGETLVFDAALTTRLRSYVRARRTTAFAVLHAAFGLWLNRLTGSRDFVVGVPMSGQLLRGIDSLVGHCVQFLPLRQRILPGATFSKHVDAVFAHSLEAMDHAHVSFGELLRVMSWRRDPARPSPLPVVFSMNPPAEVPAFPGATVRLSETKGDSTNVELGLAVIDAPEGIRLQCEYCTDLFEPVTIRRWLGHLVTLLHDALARPEAPLESLAITTSEETRALLALADGPAYPLSPDEPLLHAAFARNVRTRPDFLALSDGRESLDYRALGDRASRLARSLAMHGVVPGARVALHLSRSIEFVVAVLAVLETGATFVPLDVQWPAERRQRVIEASGATLVLVAQIDDSTLPPLPPGTLVLETTSADVSGPASAASPDCRPDSLAYVVFTSGSTGEPKGVEVEHRAIATHIASIAHRYEMAATDRTLLFHSTAFDPTIEQLFCAFSVGASVHVRGDELWTGAEFADVVARTGLTIADVPPRYLQQVLGELRTSGRIEALSRLRLVIVGGEALPPSLAQLWRSCGLDGVRLINSYGPTECSVTATCHEIPADPCRSERAGRVPIGRPHGPVRALVLDEALRPVPLGVRGGLFLGGPTLARGYTGRADLTDERFLPNPFHPGERLYRTGDIARMLPDGTIEFFGREDRQVQIRGYRVEPAEIEAQLALHPALEHAAVIVTEGAEDEPVLVGFFAARSGGSPTIEDVRSWLAKRLPGYMIPARLARVEEWPVDSSGKTDLRRLASLDTVEVDRRAPLRLPATATEARLHALWQLSLGIEDIGVDDDFFDLGGHSLLAIEMLARINRSFDVRLGIAQLLEATTIAELGRRIDAMDTSRSPRGTDSDRDRWRFLLPIQPKGDRPPVFFCAGGHGSEEEFVVVAHLARLLGEEQPVVGLRVGGHDRLAPLHADAKSMAADVFAEVRRFQPAGPYFFVGECVGGVLAAALASCAERHGETVALLGLLDTAVPNTRDALLARIESHWFSKLLSRAWTQASKIGGVPWRDLPAFLRSKTTSVRTHVEIATVGSGPSTLMPEDPALYHYFRMLIRHRPETVACPVTAFDSEEFAATGLSRRWRSVARGGVELVPLVGTHHSYIRADAEENARRMRNVLEAKLGQNSRVAPWRIPVVTPNTARPRAGRRDARENSSAAAR